MLSMQVRRNVSLILLVGLLIVTGVVWSMGSQAEGLKDGVYFGQAQGFAGNVGVDVTISGGRIAKIEVRPHDETPFSPDRPLKAGTDHRRDAEHRYRHRHRRNLHQQGTHRRR